MKIKTIVLSAVLLLSIVLSSAYSNEINHLESIVEVCEKCHGYEGNSTRSSYPKLAGQNKLYLLKQINAFRHGKRTHSVIKEILSEESESTIDILADYFSTLMPDITHAGIDLSNNPFTAISADVEPVILNKAAVELFIESGQTIYQACTGCHGLEGEGIAPYPRLAGQQPEYLTRQLTKFRSGKRTSSVMNMMSINLSDEDIIALSLYLATLPEYDSQTLTYRDLGQSN